MPEYHYPAKIEPEVLNQLPVLQYNDRNIVVVNSLADAEKVCAFLQTQPLLGFDTETRPSFSKGQHYKMSLVQLSAGKECFLFRVNQIGVPPALKALLINGNVLKIGLSLKDDFRALSQFMSERPVGFLDLQSVVSQVGIAELGLQRMYAILFGQRISKAQRLTNWEAPELTDKQQMYAAIDAWACVEIFEKIKDELGDIQRFIIKK